MAKIDDLLVKRFNEIGLPIGYEPEEWTELAEFYDGERVMVVDRSRLVQGNGGVIVRFLPKDGRIKL